MDESGIEATQALDFGDYDEEVTDDEQSENTPVGYLNVACQRGFSGKQYPVFEGDNVIGRGDECKISIPLKPLSREHACIEVKGDSHFIYDKGSRNRTRRNNHFLAASVRYELKHNDKLIFGDVECEYALNGQTANNDDDDGDETGSESMFQTAPGDEMLDDSVEANEKTETKPSDDGDYASDASSDILEPTQPFAGNTQSMLGKRTHNGNSTLAMNTPAVSKSKRFTEDLVLPESDSDTDCESPSKPPATMAIVADSQDDDDDENMKSRMMGAATQAYVCESDVTTDDEDSVRNKSSILGAPTQAFLDDDVSTCSEDSPEKKSLLTAATQAFPSGSDDDKTPKKSRKVLATVAYDMDTGIDPTVGYDMDSDTEVKEKKKVPKKSGKIAPTVAYDMNEGEEPTQGYDMDADSDDENEETEEEQKSSGILFEPTQAYVGKEVDDDKEDVGDAKSDTSEEFVLEGDTDAEDDDDAPEILAAPTLAVDNLEECETMVVTMEEETQVVDDKEGEDATVAVAEEAIQVFDEPKSTQGRISGGKGQRKSAESNVAETQVFEDDATQVFDNDDPKSSSKKANEQTAETQVFNDDATQCFDDKNDVDNKNANVAETQVFDEFDEVAVKGNASKKVEASKQNEMATQEFEQGGEGVATDDEGETFDITAASTLAFVGEPDDECETEEDEKAEAVEGGEEATQVFDDVDQTAAVNYDQTQPVKSEAESENPGRRRGKQKNVDETVPITDDATQVFEDKSAETKASRGRRNQVVDDTVAVSDDATQVFEEHPVETKASRGKRKQAMDDTVAVSDDATQVFDETVAVTDEDQTVSVEDISSKTKQSSKKQGKKSKQDVSEDATQVFDETVAVSGEDQTVPVKEVENPTKSAGRRKGKKSEQIKKLELSEETTQIFDETIAVSETVAVEEIESKTKPASKRRGKKNEQTAKQEINEDATQVFDETVAVDPTVPMEELKTKKITAKKSRGKKGENSAKQETSEEATQIFDDTVAVKDDVDAGPMETPTCEKPDKEEINDTVPVSEDMEVDAETDTAHINKTETEEDTSSGKGKRTRGKCPINKDVKDNVSKNKANKKSNSKIIIEKTEELVGNVRKSGRTRGKTAMAGNEEVNNDSKLSTTNSKEVPKVESKRKGKGKAAKKREEPDVEPATQMYGDDDEGDEEATQRYEDIEDDDQTPDLAEIEEENNVSVKVVEAEPSRGRSPLKSALASPKKKEKSPSPKKVQFVSQNSETGSESGEPTRRSKRANKGLKKANDQADEEDIERSTKAIKPVPVAANKRSMRGKSSVKTEKVETDKLEETEEVTNADNIENKTEEPATNAKPTRGNSVKTKRAMDSKTESENTSEVSSEIVNKVTTKSTRRGGRRSVDTETSVKQSTEKRNPRTSLPIVLEESKPETSQESEKTKDNEVIIEKQKTTDGKVKGKKNVKVKGKNSQEDSETASLESSESQEALNAVSVDTEPSVKRSGRSTRTNVGSGKTRNVKETQSDTTNDNSGKSEDNSTTRSQRTSRRKTAKDDADVNDNGDDQVKKRKVDHVIAEGDKREESPVTSSRTRTTRNKVVDNDTSDTKPVVEKEEVRHKSKGKNSKNGKNSSDKNENKESNSEGSANNILKEETIVTDENQKVKGKAAKGKKDNNNKVESKTVEKDVKTEPFDNEVIENENKGLTRSKRGKGTKAPTKEEEKEELPVEEVGRSRRLKRKESASSSNDSQENDRGGTPAKRQKKKTVEDNSTPKLAEKKKSTVSTPKGAAMKELDTSVTNSPTLRKKTMDEMKPKVMFTGVVDEQGEKIVKDLGGELVSSVTDCTHLVTDQVRRTVKFLCCLSRGIPIVSPQWLVSSKASGFFLDPSNFLVKDEAAERKYKFSLEHSLEKAAKDPVFRAFTFKITKSVKPEPQHMKEILKCAGARKFVDKMPDDPGMPLTVVISCPEDQDECEPAYKVGIPVMTNEFALTGILRQEMDLYSFKLVKKEAGNKRQAATSSQETSKKRKR